MKRILTAFLLSLLLVAPAAARRRMVVPFPVRIVAYVGSSPEGIRPDFTWRVSYRGQEYQLLILQLRVLNGRATALSINAAVQPYQSRFLLAGEKHAIEQFIAVPPRQQVVLGGNLRLDAGARYLMLDRVEMGPSPTALPTPASEP